MLIERWPDNPDRADVLRVALEIVSERWPAIQACAASMRWLSSGEVEHLIAYYGCPLWPADAGSLAAAEAVHHLDDWKRETDFYDRNARQDTE